MARQFTIPQFSQLKGSERYCHELVGMFSNNFQPSIPKIVWHYTSAENLQSIINSDQIWFRHISTLNDKREAVFAAELSRVILSAYPHFKGLTSREAGLLDVLQSRLINTREESGWFTASFTIAKDEQYHWTKYGDNGEGVAIGFKSKELIRFLSPSCADRVVPFKIIYRQSEALKFGTLLLEHGLDAFRRDFSSYGDDSIAIAEFIAQWASLVDVFSIAFKEAEPWKIEREFRLARLARLPRQEIWKGSRSAQSDSNFNSLPISSVILGPEIPETKRARIRRDLFLSCHKSVVVLNSRLPLLGEHGRNAPSPVA